MPTREKSGERKLEMNVLDEDTPPSAEKKVYEKPQLVTYGDISDLTRNVTNTGTTSDNPTMKT